MPGLGLSLSLGARNPSLGGDQVIWRVLISGAGTESSNGEYIWDGIAIQNGKQIYNSQSGNAIAFFLEGEYGNNVWIIDDATAGATPYYSFNLSTWISSDIAYDPAPTAQLFYTP